MITRPLRWLHRLAAVLALTGVLVGPQSMVAAACPDSSMGGHHQSHQHQQPAVPQHCCDLCSVVCSGTGLHVASGPPLIPEGSVSLAAGDSRFESSVVVSIRFLHPLALGPPALLV